MRKLILLSLAAAAASLSTVAPAAPIINFNGNTGIFGNVGIDAGAFTDNYEFELNDPGILGAVITSIAVDGATNLTFSSVLLNNVAFTPIVAGSSEFRSREGIRVTAGDQTLQVNGVSGGNSSYSGVLAFAAQQVPEPGTMATMAVALTFLGGGMSLSRRNRRRTA